MAVTEQKQAIVAQMKDTLSEAKGAVLVGYSGLTVAQATDLRRRFLAEGVEYKVIKNTLTRIAANELGLEGFTEHLEGPTALASSKEDAVAPARIIEKFIKETEKEVVTVKAGIVEGEVMDAAGIKVIANLPNREGMLSMLLSVLQAPVRNVAYAVKAVAEKEPVAAE
ncbi:50S ribosomal protein L10 [Veillonella sp. YH-vei2232]|jgi:large subunit ribosomal protein L10|uniref:Large ribosomal subunit protein uL10 n=1 Tax=Veillonella absiana TaxID=3079305 RepID=A0ABU3ZB43_9FIRM|nr:MULTISPECIES: 50S ribosomal protein L10 [unclassified Veillonella]NCB95700.1 50S ribosomal protein L10 [Negativicutes bacterium]MBK7920757.1 50S ribosomal protein L10 [Veillonella sp.]MBP6922379.1 50S ribosomal protein L10 [Veillonella sp.]MBP8616878.1 50S ribosomal protein L10 [Veillonella sp.]MBP9516841.1 50S ribosomal protein L10 [Veillonella sp.]